MEELTYERALELARKIVSEFGEDYVYPENHKERGASAASAPSCMYVHDGQPSCLVGHVLYRHGVSIKDLVDREFLSAWEVAAGLVASDEKTRQFLEAVQVAQDKGTTWNQAVDQGVKFVEEVFNDF